MHNATSPSSAESQSTSSTQRCNASTSPKLPNPLPNPRDQSSPPHLTPYSHPPTPAHLLLPAAQVTRPNLQTKALIAAGIELMRPPGARGPALNPETGLARHICLHVRLGDFSKVSSESRRVTQPAARDTPLHCPARLFLS